MLLGSQPRQNESIPLPSNRPTGSESRPAPFSRNLAPAGPPSRPRSAMPRARRGPFQLFALALLAAAGLLGRASAREHADREREMLVVNENLPFVNNSYGAARQLPPRPEHEKTFQQIPSMQLVPHVPAPAPRPRSLRPRPQVRPERHQRPHHPLRGCAPAPPRAHQARSLLFPRRRALTPLRTRPRRVSARIRQPRTSSARRGSARTPSSLTDASSTTTASTPSATGAPLATFALF